MNVHLYTYSHTVLLPLDLRNAHNGTLGTILATVSMRAVMKSQRDTAPGFTVSYESAQCFPSLRFRQHPLQICTISFLLSSSTDGVCNNLEAPYAENPYQHHPLSSSLHLRSFLSNIKILVMILETIAVGA